MDTSHGPSALRICWMGYFIGTNVWHVVSCGESKQASKRVLVRVGKGNLLDMRYSRQGIKTGSYHTSWSGVWMFKLYLSGPAPKPYLPEFPPWILQDVRKQKTGLDLFHSFILLSFTLVMLQTNA